MTKEKKHEITDDFLQVTDIIHKQHFISRETSGYLYKNQKQNKLAFKNRAARQKFHCACDVRGQSGSIRAVSSKNVCEQENSVVYGY